MVVIIYSFGCGLRIKIQAQPVQVAGLPVNYNSLIQAMIYKNLSKSFRVFLHNHGFLLGNRPFKLFTFSKLFGKCKFNNKKIYFMDTVTLYVSSPVKRFLKDLVASLMKRGTFLIGKNLFTIEKIELLPLPQFNSTHMIETLSPITMYSTLYTVDQRKKTYYYSPFEREFEELIGKNLRKKCKLVYHRTVETPVKIKPLRVRERVIIFKKNVIKAWEGKFQLTTGKLLFKTGYETGLGSKNSQGFGMFRVIG